MSDQPSRLVHYPGHHGEEAVARFRDPNRAARFRRGQVRMLRDPEARDLVRLGGFQEAIDFTAAAERYGYTAKHLKALAKEGEITTASYQSAEGAAQDVVVLDSATRRRLRPATAAAPDPNPDQPAPGGDAAAAQEE